MLAQPVICSPRGGLNIFYLIWLSLEGQIHPSEPIPNIAVMMSSATQPRVPTEVAEQIIDVVGGGSKRSALQSCSLVCRAWLPRSRLRLFEDVEIVAKQHLDNLLRVFETVPHLRAAVQGVHAHSRVAEAAVAILLGQLPNIHTWTFEDTLCLGSSAAQSRIITASLRTYPSLDTLNLCHVTVTSFHRFATFLSSVPGIRHLGLHDLKVVAPDTETTLNTIGTLNLLSLDTVSFI